VQRLAGMKLYGVALHIWRTPLFIISPPTASGKMLEDLLIIGEKRCITTGCHFLVNFCTLFSLFYI
jgi:hypothetical protein